MEETALEEIQEKINTPNKDTALAIHMSPNEVLKTLFFSYKGKDYKVIKIVRTRVGFIWLIGVEYQALYEVGLHEWDGSFVRPIEDFLSKFTPTQKNTEEQ